MQERFRQRLINAVTAEVDLGAGNVTGKVTLQGLERQPSKRAVVKSREGWVVATDMNLKRIAIDELVRCYGPWLVCQLYSLLLYQFYAPVHVATN